MTRFEVMVGRKVWQTATVQVEAATAEDAEELVDRQLATDGEDSLTWRGGDSDGPAEVEDAWPVDC